MSILGHQLCQCHSATHNTYNNNTFIPGRTGAVVQSKVQKARKLYGRCERQNCTELAIVLI